MSNDRNVRPTRNTVNRASCGWSIFDPGVKGDVSRLKGDNGMDPNWHKQRRSAPSAPSARLGAIWIKLTQVRWVRARRLLRQVHSSVLGASIRIAKRFDPHLCTPLPPPPGVGRGVRRERASAPRGLHKRVQSEWAGIRNCLRKARLHL